MHPSASQMLDINAHELYWLGHYRAGSAVYEWRAYVILADSVAVGPFVAILPEQASLTFYGWKNGSLFNCLS